MTDNGFVASFGCNTKIRRGLGKYRAAYLADEVEKVLAEYGFSRLDGGRKRFHNERNYRGVGGEIIVAFARGHKLLTKREIRDEGFEEIIEAPVFLEFLGIDEGLAREILDDVSEIDF